jgi:hypothetical protein
VLTWLICHVFSNVFPLFRDISDKLFNSLQALMRHICHVLGILEIHTTWLACIIMLGILPVVSANSSQSPFPDIPCHVFNGFVQNHFSSQISLTTVLTILFSLTNNPDLLNLHARQQHPKAEGEIAQTTSGCIKALAHALENRLANATATMFHGEENKSELTNDQVVTHIDMKPDGLAKVLKLDPYDKRDQFCEKLKPVSEQNIEPVYVICPGSSECETMECQSHFTQEHDTSKATLIKGTKIHDNVPVLAGQFPVCLTTYHADHEHFKSADGTWTKLYLNSARHLKVGQKIWVDCTFSTAVLNGTYHFHASSSAFAEFWNSSFWSTQNTISQKVSQHQVWQAFIQESLRKVASSLKLNLELPDKLHINEVTKQAFSILGEQGIIRSAEGHHCEVCTHEHKTVADMIPEAHDVAGVVGVDENHNIPEFVGEQERDVDADDNEDMAMDVDEPVHGRQSHPTTSIHQEQQCSFVQMVVLDGIVMGPKHCAFENCTADLVNYRNGVFCTEHENMQGNLCRIQGCH